MDTSFPAVVMELSSHEIKQYFTPKDFSVGETVMIYGRRFIIYDCDNFTKSFYYHTFGVTEFPTVNVSQKLKDLPKMVRLIKYKTVVLISYKYTF